MTRKRSFVLSVLILTLAGFAAGAHAAQFMFGGFMGLNVPFRTLNVNYRASPYNFTQNGASPAYAGSLGLRLGNHWRLEAEVSYTEASGARGGGEQQSKLSLANVYYDFDTGNKRLRPFLSLGFGTATRSLYHGGMDGVGVASDSSTGLAVQAGGGLNYQVNDDVQISGGYRHLTFSGDGDSDTAPVDKGSHELRLGLHYQFPMPKAAPLDKGQALDYGR